MTFNLLEHPICFEKPKYISGQSAWIEHIPFAFALVSILSPQIIVELGTHHGDSYLAFCQAVKQLNTRSKCYAVDTWKGDEHAGFYGQQVLENLRRHHDDEYGAFSRLIQATFDEAAAHFQEESIDLLHIDGMHSYEAVKHDLTTWLPKMSQSGVVLIHDTNVRERQFGVWRLWEEIALEYPQINFIHGHGLGVIEAKGQSKLHELLKLPAEQQQVVANFFFKLGNFISNDFKAKSIITEQQAHIDILTQGQIQKNNPDAAPLDEKQSEASAAKIQSHAAETGKLENDFNAILADRIKAQEIIESQNSQLVALRNDFNVLMEDRAKAQRIMDAQAEELTSLRKKT